MRNKLALMTALVLTLGIHSAPDVLAQSRFWTGALSTAWENPGNWSPLGVPLTNESIFVGSSTIPEAEATLDNLTNVEVTNLTIQELSLLEIQGDLEVSNFATIEPGSELRFRGFSNTTPTLVLSRNIGVGLNNDGVLHVVRGGAVIDAPNGGTLDLDGTSGDGHILLERGLSSFWQEVSLRINGPLNDDFNGILELGNYHASDSADLIFDMDEDWAVGSGGQILFKGNHKSIIRGEALSVASATIDMQSEGRIESPITLIDTLVSGEPSNKLSLTDTASLQGNLTLEPAVEVGGVGEIAAGSQVAINTALNFLNTASIEDSTLDLRGGLRLGGGSILNTTISVPPSSVSGGLIGYSGPLTIGGTSNIDVDVLWNELTDSRLTITGGEVAAKNWSTSNLDLRGGEASVVRTGNISLPGGLSFGSSEFPRLRIEEGSIATIGPTGNGDLTMGFLNGDLSELFVEGLGSTGPGNPPRQSELSAGNARIGNRGQGVLVVQDGGRANFSGNVKVGEFLGALGAITINGVAAEGSQQFHSEVHVGDTNSDIVADLEVANFGEGYLTILNGGYAEVTGDVYFGQGIGGSGSLTVGYTGMGSDSVLNVAGDIHLGGEGSAFATLYEGGAILGRSLQVKSGGGYYQSGGTTAAQTLDITDGGNVTITDGIALLQNFSRTGTGSFNHTGGEVQINGGTAAFNNSYAFGGPSQANQPRLIIEGGTDATVTFGFRVADQAGEHGQAIVTGATSTARSTLRGTGGGAGADLYVGRFGSGGLHIEEGGYVKILDDTLIASEAGSFGVLGVLGTTEVSPGNFVRAELDVTGRGSQSSLEIGRGGHGILSLGNGGLVRVGGNATAGVLAGSRGEIHVFGQESGLPAELDIAGTLRVGSAGEGVLNLSDGGLVKASRLNVGASGTLNMTGGLLSLETLDATSGTTSFTGGEIDIDAVLGSVNFDSVTVLPGDSPGLMTIDGSAVFKNTTLEIEIGGSTAGKQYDQLAITGRALLDGILDIQLYDWGLGAYQPAAGDEFTILTADGGISGRFDSITADILPNGLFWDLAYRGRDLLLKVASAFDPADFDQDGDVDARDLAYWQSDYGVGGSDADQDGDSDGNDFLAWQRQFNGNPGASLATAAVPEPASLLLMLSGLTAIALRRTR